MKTRDTEQRFPVTLLLIFLLLLVGIGLAGYLYHVRQLRAIRQNMQHELSAIADLKTAQIVVWRNERIADAAVVFKSPFIVTEVQRFLSAPASTAHKQQLNAWLKALKEQYGYIDASLVDREGTVRLSTSAHTILTRDELLMLRQALHHAKPVLSDIENGERLGRLHLDLFSPFVVTRKQTGVPIGALVFRIDPRTFLYPLISQWPTESSTAETLLVRKEGKDVVFLNELRHKQGKALSVRMPVSDEDLPASMAVRGVRGEVEGRDYRDVPVLAALRAIPDTPWFMVAKVDLSEIDAPVRAQAWQTALFMVGLVALAGLGTAYRWRKQNMLYYRQRLDAELERQEERTQALKERERNIARLQEALSKVKTLSGMLPICASCRKVRDDQGYWKQLEAYISDHSETEFSHGLCPECAQRLYPGYYQRSLVHEEGGSEEEQENNKEPETT